MRITTLQWTVGMLCALMGAMMLIVPHRFEAPTYAAFLPLLLWWGVAFLLTGIGLLAAAVLAPLRWLAVVAHLSAGVMLLMVARGFASNGIWVRSLDYGILGLGTTLAPFLPQGGTSGARAYGRDLLALLLGVGAMLTGLAIFTVPTQFDEPFYDLVRVHLPWYGVAFIVIGLALVYVQVRPQLPRALAWVVYLSAGGTFLAFMAKTAVPLGYWTGIAFLGGFGILLALLPWLDPVLQRIKPTSLRIRLALAMIIAVAVPLVVAVTIVTDRAERSATAQALTLQQTIAATLADDISRYLTSHRAAAAALAKVINLSRMTPAQKEALLRTFGEEYPDVFSFATYDDRGHLIARGDSYAREFIGGEPVFEKSLQTNTVALAVEVVPISNQLFFEFGAPLRGPGNAWSGLLVLSAESTRVVAALDKGAGAGGLAYMVDGQGRVLVHRDASLNGSFQDVSDAPPVRALLSGTDAEGVTRYRGRSGEQLAGYARIGRIGWGVVVERPLAVALAGTHAGREIAFILLLLMTGGAAVGGTIAAGVLARPLEALARGAKRLGEDDAPMALPDSNIAEVRDLSATFGEMRARLAARTEERARAYEALREREARIRSIMDSTSDGFIFVGRDGRIRSANQRAAAMLPLQAAWGAGEDFSRVLPEHGVRPAERELVLTTLRSLLEGREPTGQGDLELLGGQRVLHWDAQPAKDDSGAMVGLTFTLHDVTREREVSRMKSDFVSFVTHQLRTPLAGIKWLLELAAGTQDRGEVQDYIQDAREANERLVTLVNDLLDISRLESGRLAISPEELDIVKMTQNVLEELSPLIKEKGHRLSLNGVSEIPPVVADPQLLRQVILNLVSNAIKYTPPPGEIALKMRPENGSVEWAIQDNGIGIPKDALPRLFEKFYRADNVHKIETEGTGLGLYLVRLIVERLGGRIWCESEEGKGSIFLFTVPLSGGHETWTLPASGS